MAEEAGYDPADAVAGASGFQDRRNRSVSAIPPLKWRRGQVSILHGRLISRFVSGEARLPVPAPLPAGGNERTRTSIGVALRLLSGQVSCQLEYVSVCLWWTWRDSDPQKTRPERVASASCATNR